MVAERITSVSPTTNGHTSTAHTSNGARVSTGAHSSPTAAQTAPTAAQTEHTAHTSTADLMSDAAAQISRLVHDELALAKLEMQTKAKQAGLAGGLLGAALVLARIGFVLAWVLLIVALANVWPWWLAVFVPMIGAFAVAGVLALVGRSRLKAATPPVPTEATQSVQTDLRTAQETIQEGRRS